MRARRPQLWFAFSALLVAWLGVSFSALLHLDGHGHRFCAEHGTIEEGAAPGGHGVASSDAHGEDESSARLLAGAASDEGAEHAECPLATLPGRDALRASGLVAVTDAPVFAAPVLAAARAAHAPLTQLAVAPKASPPTV